MDQTAQLSSIQDQISRLSQVFRDFSLQNLQTMSNGRLRWISLLCSRNIFVYFHSSCICLKLASYLCNRSQQVNIIGFSFSLCCICATGSVLCPLLFTIITLPISCIPNHFRFLLQ